MKTDILKVKDNIMVIKCLSDIISAELPFYKEEINNEYEKINPNIVIFDLTEVLFIDSAGIGFLISYYKKLKTEVDTPMAKADGILGSPFRLLPELPER